MITESEKELIRLFADGKAVVSAEQRESFLALCAREGVAVRRSRCKSCLQDAAFALLAKAESEQVQDVQSEVRLRQRLNFNGSYYDVDTPSEEVHRLIARGLPLQFVELVDGNADNGTDTME